MRLIQRLPLSPGLPAEFPRVLEQMRLGMGEQLEAHHHVRAAAAELEAYCGVAILPQTITAETDDAPGALLHLPVRPVLDPASLAITTASGATVTTWRLVSAAHAVVRFVTPPDEPVTVTYNAGHATLDDVPPDLLHAIGDQALRLYDLRGAEEGTQGLSLAAARIGEAGERRTDARPCQPVPAMTWARECEHCGGPIADHKRADAMYCSQACNKAAYADVLRAGLLSDKANRPPCLHCGAAIPPEANARKQFCCITCYRRARKAKDRAARPVQTCPACGGGFQATRLDGGQIYCSHQCGQEAYRTGHPIDCHQCGTKIQNPRQQQKFCDKLCQGRWNRAKRRARGR